MSGRRILFFITIWLVPVVILVAFITIIRMVIKSETITVAVADSKPVIVKPSPNAMPKNNDNLSDTSTTGTAAEKPKSLKFYDALNRALTERRRKLEELCERGDTVAERVLNDYGAVFMAHNSVLTPPVCMFTDSASVSKFQNSTEIAAENINGATIELQKPAMKALLNARNEARQSGLDITPRDGAEAARRSFEDTLRLWDSRFLPALIHWGGKGKISDGEAERLKNLPLKQQVSEVLKLEERGIFFSKDFSKSILHSVAAPGCSQHLSMLAFDANEFQNPQVRAILAKHGWFRTVQNDLPHFTFLGYKENELTSLGLLRMETKDGDFWIPNI